MRENLGVLPLYPSGEALSNVPQVVIQWPEGLENPAVLYPLGDSEEESEAIRGMLVGLLQGAKEGEPGPGEQIG